MKRKKCTKCKQNMPLDEGKKFKRVMEEFTDNKLNSGSKRGPKVKNPKQAVAIAYSEQRKANKKKKK